MSRLSEESRRIYTERLSHIVDVIDRTGSTLVFKVKRDLDDIEEKLILAHVNPKLEYLTVDYNSHGGFSHILFNAGHETYSSGGYMADSFADECCIIADLIDYV